MASKKKAKTTGNNVPTAGRRVVDLDALLGNSPVITLGGRKFDGREFTMRERMRWMQSEERADPTEQMQLLADVLTARGTEPVTVEWLESSITYSQAFGLVEALFSSSRGGEGNA